MNLRLKRTPGLYVVGFMGAGTSAVGRHLAAQLGWSFFSTDDEIERAEGCSLASLIETRGEAEFRRIESLILMQHVGWIERGRPAVLALGEGAFDEPANRDLLLRNGIAIWLDCPLETAKPERDSEQLAALYHARREGYALADLHVAMESHDPDDAVRAILAHPLLK